MLRLLKFLLLFSLFFVSCRSKNKVEQPMIKDFDLLQRANNDYTTIDLEHAEELAYRELIDSIRYISLGDECGVMGNIANIITYKGRFYIQEEQFDRVFIYDDTGRCLKKIDNKGRGPGEYLRIESIDINTEKEELMLVDGMSDKLFFYDLDGNFKSIHSIRYFQTENTLCLRDSVFLHISAPSQNFGNEGLYGYALVLSKGNENFLKGYRYLPLQVGYKGGGQIFKGYERSCYHPIYSDTIYQILSDTTYGPIFYFKIKNSSWEKYHNSDRFVDIDGSEEGVFTLLYENQDFFLGYIADKKKKGNYMQPFLYDKMKDKTYLLRWCDYYEHLKELDYFEGYEARGIFEDYFIAHVSFSTLDQYNIFGRVKDGALKITNPELERVIQNLNTDSNPVLILTKFKHL
ncbi:MAG: 6-bladed beta-propeller [Odoribacter splanchnicus]|jgi:hypothetical protein|uniref:6-bladed beta-propeller n=3 Tax=Odoribacter splanchnicus TaxID=28118 RepID=UPI00130B6CD7|nr:6-bladed beta-propeller [Odoribacter splanchnicus]MRZ88968.1 6-bladed beta-propeller [Odoribacter splanchnicus]MSA50084.1 6-bladed beta-propeller [Odoribacter splanchnicus]MSA54582.1 6-bladed beta-propeller [Odoribacter splanchnicus]MSA65338.1 6-bladed beta-propeller [Odoribacter splanchnicus]MSA83631.1 6-bladed beta-propeller [Odoribacter splanchnicus]